VTTALDEAALLVALEHVRSTLEQATGTLSSASAALSRGQTQLDGVNDAGRAAPGRGRDVRASLQLFHESLERAKLGALNAGLEAARLGDPLSKIVMQLASDTRELVARALETLEGHRAILGEADRERERWLDGVGQASESLRALGLELSSLQKQHKSAEDALAELERALAPALSTDPETARLLHFAAEQSGQLATTLRALADRDAAGDSERLRKALAPLLEALGAKAEREP